jgi:hypothetical protein
VFRGGGGSARCSNSGTRSPASRRSGAAHAGSFHSSLRLSFIEYSSVDRWRGRGPPAARVPPQGRKPMIDRSIDRSIVRTGQQPSVAVSSVACLLVDRCWKATRPPPRRKTEGKSKACRARSVERAILFPHHQKCHWHFPMVAPRQSDNRSIPSTTVRKPPVKGKDTHRGRNSQPPPPPSHRCQYRRRRRRPTHGGAAAKRNGAADNEKKTRRRLCC